MRRSRCLCTAVLAATRHNVDMGAPNLVSYFYIRITISTSCKHYLRPSLFRVIKQAYVTFRLYPHREHRY